MGVRRSQHDGMHHSGQRIVIEVRRAPRYETLIFTASGSIANLPAGHWWLSLSRFRVAPLPMSRAAKTLLSEEPSAMLCSSLLPKKSRTEAQQGAESGCMAAPPAGLFLRQPMRNYRTRDQHGRAAEPDPPYAPQTTILPRRDLP